MCLGARSMRCRPFSFSLSCLYLNKCQDQSGESVFKSIELMSRVFNVHWLFLDFGSIVFVDVAIRLYTCKCASSRHVAVLTLYAIMISLRYMKLLEESLMSNNNTNTRKL